MALLLISATLFYLSTIPLCMSVVGKDTSEPETSDGTFIATLHQVT